MMLDWLKQRLVDMIQWFADTFVALFTALWDLIKDAFCWIIEQSLGIVTVTLNSLDVSGLMNYASSWGGLPSEIINVMGLLGFGTAAAIVTSAVVIRFILQLIPFVRWGS
jgi:hypothetical protein